MNIYEILVPATRADGKPYKTKYHKGWDARVREITGGLTIAPPVKGHWKDKHGQLYVERMIPVRIACAEWQINVIAELTAKYYDQKAVMYYLISDKVIIKNYNNDSTGTI